MSAQRLPNDVKPPVTADPWAQLAEHTAARIALGRCGGSLPTAETLRFALSHAQARDAVHSQLDTAPLAAGLAEAGFATLTVASAARDRAEYLQRPDYGRRLDRASHARLAAAADKGADVVLVIGDGLSSRAIERHALPFVLELRPLLEQAEMTLGPLVIATQARVALGDEVGELLHAHFVVMLIGERPGLSSPDSMGLYLTHAPRVGRMDAERNCISNVRLEGLPYHAAAHKLAWLLDAAGKLGVTGVGLKDESDSARLPTAGEGRLGG